MDASRHAQTETRAIVSLFLGIASFAFGPLAGIPAIALGSAARKTIAQSGSKSRGSLVATTGTMFGFFGMGFFMVFSLYLGNAVLSASASTETAQVTPSTTVEAKVTAPVAPTRPVVRRELEMTHSPR